MRDLVNLSERLERGLVLKIGPSLGIKRAKRGASAKKRGGFFVQRRTLVITVLLIVALAALGAIAAIRSNFEVSIVQKRGEATDRMQRAAAALQETQLQSELAGRLARESTEGRKFRAFQRMIRKAETQLTANITQILGASSSGGTNGSVAERLVAAINTTYARVDSIFRPIVATMSDESSDSASRLRALHKQLSSSLDESVRLQAAGGEAVALAAATVAKGAALSAADRAALKGSEATLHAIVANFLNHSTTFARDAPRVVLETGALARIEVVRDRLVQDELDEKSAKASVDAEDVGRFTWREWVGGDPVKLKALDECVRAASLARSSTASSYAHSPNPYVSTSSFFSSCLARAQLRVVPRQYAPQREILAQRRVASSAARKLDCWVRRKHSNALHAPQEGQGGGLSSTLAL